MAYRTCYLESSGKRTEREPGALISSSGILHTEMNNASEKKQPGIMGTQGWGIQGNHTIYIVEND